MSLSAALATAAQLNSANLDSTAAMATDFLNLMYSYIATSKQTFEDAEVALNEFKERASKITAGFGKELQDASDAVRDIVRLSSTNSKKLKGDSGEVMRTIKSKLDEDREIDNKDNEDGYADIRDLTEVLDKAQKESKEIDDAQRDAVTKLTEWALPYYQSIVRTSTSGSLDDLAIDKNPLVGTWY